MCTLAYVRPRALLNLFLSTNKWEVIKFWWMPQKFLNCWQVQCKIKSDHTSNSCMRPVPVSQCSNFPQKMWWEIEYSIPPFPGDPLQPTQGPLLVPTKRKNVFSKLSLLCLIRNKWDSYFELTEVLYVFPKPPLRVKKEQNRRKAGDLRCPSPWWPHRATRL